MRLNDSEFAHLTPPCGLYAWKAGNQFRASYLRVAESQVKTHIEEDPHLSHLSPKFKRVTIDANMTKVNAYCDEVLKVYLSRVDKNGMPAWKLAESKTELLRNIIWTIKFQVLEQTYSEIAEASGKSVSTVKREVESILSLIDLPMRPGVKRGRRPGSKESPDSRRRSVKRAGLLK